MSNVPPPPPTLEEMFQKAKMGTMKGRGKIGKRAEKSERARKKKRKVWGGIFSKHWKNIHPWSDV